MFNYNHLDQAYSDDSSKLTVEQRQDESSYVAKLVSNNLQYQQLWTNIEKLEITLSTDSSFAPSAAIPSSSISKLSEDSSSSNELTQSIPEKYKLTILTAVPPKKLLVEDPVPADYKEETDNEGNVKVAHGQLYKEFILPCITEQEWSIREWVEVFEELDKVWASGVESETDQEGWEKVGGGKSDSFSVTFVPDYKPRRLIMACVTNDGTVVYYIINRDITPPRRN